jgi:hypothetical protein
MAKTETDPIKELDILFPENEIFGYKVKKYCVGEFKKAMGITSRNAGLFSENYPIYLMGAGEEAIDDIIDLILFSTDVPPESIEGMGIDEFIAILIKIFQVNISFFSAAVVKAVTDLKAEQEDGGK